MPKPIRTGLQGADRGDLMCTKRCSRCSRERPVHAFGADRSRSDGLTRYCRDCRRRSNKPAPASKHQDVPLTRGRTLRVALHEGDADRLVLSIVHGSGRVADSALVLPAAKLPALQAALHKLRDTHNTMEVTRGDMSLSDHQGGGECK